MPPFHAVIEQGEIVFRTVPHATAWKRWKHEHEGAAIILDVDRFPRSSSQNRYYWAYLEIIARETGDNATDLHEVFKRELLPPVFKTIRGKEYKLPGSTRDLDKLGFTDYLDKIGALSGVPLPDPDAAGYVSNT